MDSRAGVILTADDADMEKIAHSVSFEAMADAIIELEEEEHLKALGNQIVGGRTSVGDDAASYITYPPELQDSPSKNVESNQQFEEDYKKHRHVADVMNSAGVDYVSVEDRETILGDVGKDKADDKTDKVPDLSSGNLYHDPVMDKVSPIKKVTLITEQTLDSDEPQSGEDEPLRSIAEIMKEVVPGYVSPSARAVLMGEEEKPMLNSDSSTTVMKTLVADTEEDTTLADISMPLSDRSSVYQSNSVSGSDLGSICTTAYVSIDKDAFKVDKLITQVNRLTPIFDVSGRSSQLTSGQSPPHFQSVGGGQSSSHCQMVGDGVDTQQFRDSSNHGVHDICQPHQNVELGSGDTAFDSDSTPRVDPSTQSSHTEYHKLPTGLLVLTPDFSTQTVSPEHEPLSRVSSANTEYDVLPKSLHESRFTPDYAENIMSPDRKRGIRDYDSSSYRPPSISKMSLNSADSQYDDIDASAFSKSSKDVLQEAALEFLADQSSGKCRIYAADDDMSQNMVVSDMSSTSEAELAKLMRTSGYSEKSTNLNEVSIKHLVDNQSSTQRLFAEGNERKLLSEPATTAGSTVSGFTNSEPPASKAISLVSSLPNYSIKEPTTSQYAPTSIKSTVMPSLSAAVTTTTTKQILSRGEFLAGVPTRSLQDLNISPSTVVSNRLDRIEFMVMSALNEAKPPVSSFTTAPARPESPDSGTTTSYMDIAKEICSQEDITTKESAPVNLSIRDEGNANVTADKMREVESKDYLKKYTTYAPLTLPNYQKQFTAPSAVPRVQEESFNLGISPVKNMSFHAFDDAAKHLADKLEQRAQEKTPGRFAGVDDKSRDYYANMAEVKGQSKDRQSNSTRRRSDLENIPDSKPLQILQAAPSPTDELVKRRTKHRSGEDESVTTLESTHTDSDDAQPPALPNDVLGSRADPTEPSPGIYGTRGPKPSASQTNDRSLTPVSQSVTASPELTPREQRQAILSKAEELLAKGQKTRETYYRDHVKAYEDSASQNREGVDVAELLNTPYKPFKHSTQAKPNPTGEKNSNTVPRYRYPHSEVDVRKHTEVYNPDTDNRNEKTLLVSQAITYLPHAYRNPESSSFAKASEQIPIVSPGQIRSRSREKVLPLEPGSDVEADVQSPSRPLAADSMINVSPIRPEMVSSCRIDDKSNRFYSSPTRELRRQSPPLERVSYDDNSNRDSVDLQARMTDARHDRQMTYHILREELLKAEDEAKNRELNLAWERITKRKPAAADFSMTSNTTTASSEAFNESRMNKLTSLLRNPLNHLVKKSKTKTQRTGSEKLAEVQPGNQRNTKLDNLYEKIYKQKDESMTLDSTANTTITSSVDTVNTVDTVCTRCEEKRQKRKRDKELAKAQKENRSTNKHCQTGPGNNPDLHKDVAVMCPSPTVVLDDQTNLLKNREKSPKRGKNKKLEESLAWYIESQKEKNIMNTAYNKSKQLDVKSAGLRWEIPVNNPRPWTKPLPERRAHAMSREPWLSGQSIYETASTHRAMEDLYQEFNDITGRTRYTPTLQEAFRDRLRRFVSGSRERQRVIKLRAQERKFTQRHEEERMKLFDLETASRGQGRTTLAAKDQIFPKRVVVLKEEMLERTRRMYKDLPEVKQKKHVDFTQQARRANRLKAKLFNKKVQRKVLEKAKLAQARSRYSKETLEIRRKAAMVG